MCDGKLAREAVLSKLSDSELLNETASLVAEERKITLEILHYLAELNDRRLFSYRGWGSLFEYCTGELGYSAAAAQRRIDGMKLLRMVPEIEEKIKKGSLNLSHLSQAQRFFRNEAKHRCAKKISEKKEILAKLENKSTREAEKELASMSSVPEAFLNRDRIQPITTTHSEIRFLAPQKLLDDLEHIRGLLAHRRQDLTLAELITEITRIALEKLSPIAKQKLKIESAGDPKNLVGPENASGKDSGDAKSKTIQATASEETESNKPRPAREQMPNPSGTSGVGNEQEVRSRTIPAAVRSAVWIRDNGRCTYKDPETGRRCISRYALELDHIHPFALGGPSTVENLVLKCRVHNQLGAIQSFGYNYMKKYLKDRKTDGSTKPV